MSVSQINTGNGGIFLPQLQTIRSDNGTEFLSSIFQTWIRTHGIFHQRSCVSTPQQNGIVERKHRHLLDVARALRFQAHLPLSFWGECVLTAAFLINKLPTPLLGLKSPHEILFGKVPSYSSLRVFGCLCFAKHMNIKHKFDFRAKPHIFVGYPYGTKGYRIYDPSIRRIHVSRDVIFYESIFPYRDATTSPQSNDIVITTLEEEHSNSWPTPNSIQIPHPIPPQETSLSNSGHLHVNDDTHSSSHHTRSSPTMIIAPERPQRVRLPPSHLSQYVCNVGKSSTSFLLGHYISWTHFSPSHCSFLTKVIDHDEPRTYSQAVKSPLWRDAMSVEIRALISNNTWSLCSLPHGKTAIGCKWVYKIKYHSDGSIDRYKARLVTKGYTQIEGIDYHDTFVPVAKLVTLRLLLSIDITKNWSLHQLDVNNAFLQGDLHEEVFMQLPPRFFSYR